MHIAKYNRVRREKQDAMDNSSHTKKRWKHYWKRYWKWIRDTRPFEGIMIITFEDLLQVPSVICQSIYWSNLWHLFFPIFLTVSRHQREDMTFIKLLNEVRVGSISDESWMILEDLYAQFMTTDMIWKSTFTIFRWDIAHSINDFIAQSLSLTSIISYAIDCENDRILSPSEITKSFKHHTDLSEELNLHVDGWVIFLDNSLIQYEISNGIIGVIIELENDTDNNSIYPIIIFPTENEIEVLIIMPIYY